MGRARVLYLCAKDSHIKLAEILKDPTHENSLYSPFVKEVLKRDKVISTQFASKKTKQFIAELFVRYPLTQVSVGTRANTGQAVGQFLRN